VFLLNIFILYANIVELMFASDNGFYEFIFVETNF